MESSTSTLGSLFSWMWDTSCDATITSTRFVTQPIVNKCINNLAFLPPNRTQDELLTLSKKSNHFFAKDDKYDISYIVCKSELYRSIRTTKSAINEKYGQTQKSCILLSHGNASDVAEMEYFCSEWATLFDLDVVCYDYIGYGLSTNRISCDDVDDGYDGSFSSYSYSSSNKPEYPTEQGCYRSIQIMVNELSKTYDKIYIVGQSIGTGVCVDYCAKNNWTDPIVLISPYKSLVRVVADTFIASTVDSSFNTFEKLPMLKCPVKIFHGENDSLISVNHAIEIFDNLPNKKFDPVWFSRCGHNDILHRITYEHLKDIFI